MSGRMTGGAAAHRFREQVTRSWPWRYLTGPAPQYAPAIAFNAFIAIFPITVGLVSLLLLLFPGQQLPRAVDRLLLEAFPTGTRREIAQLLRLVPRHLGTFGILSVLGMLWTGSGLFSCLSGALNAIHGKPARNVVRQRLVGLRLVPVMFGAITLMLLMENLGDALPRSPLAGALLAAVPLAVLITFVYRVAPSHRPPLSQVLPGALLATAAVEALTLGFPTFARVTQTTSVYGQGLGLTIVLLFWLYLISHILLAGAFVNERLAARVRDPLGHRPASSAAGAGAGAGPT